MRQTKKLMKSPVLVAFSVLGLVQGSTLSTDATTNTGGSYLSSFFWSSPSTSAMDSSASQGTTTNGRSYSILDYVNPLAYTSWWSSSSYANPESSNLSSTTDFTAASSGTEQKPRKLRPIHNSLRNTAKILEEKFAKDQERQRPDPDRVALVRKRLAERPKEADQSTNFANLVAQQATRLYGDKIKIANLHAEKRDKRITKYNIFNKKEKKFPDSKLIKVQEDRKLREMQNAMKSDMMEGLKAALAARKGKVDALDGKAHHVPRIEAAKQQTTTSAPAKPRKRFVMKKDAGGKAGDFLAELKSKVTKRK